MEKLVFVMEEIPPEGLAFDLAPDPSLYGINQVKVNNPPGISGWIKVRKDGREVIVQGEIKAELELQCGRCLAPAVGGIGGEFYFRMVPRSRMPESEEVELKEGELEVDFFTGEEVDVAEIIAEQVYLNVPMSVLCKPDCLGLCPKCGEDLNKGDCGHRGGETENRWDALKGFLREKTE